MSNEWKELKIDNLPSDILTGDYEFEYDADFWTKSDEPVIEILMKLSKPSFYYRYRKPEPKAPSHEEIMGNNKYWLGDNKEWSMVNGYNPSTKQYYLYTDENKSFPYKEWFTGRESAECPPEGL